MTDTQSRPPWTPGSATGIGSLPGTDMREALRVVLGELPDFPHLPELPARGPGSDLVGRTAQLLVELYVDLQPSGWRFCDRPGVDARRARGVLRADLDLLEELAQGYAGPFKIQVAGPWTLAAGIELRHGDKALADPGAYRDLAASLAEGLAAHVTEVSRRVPGAALVLQLDEPALPMVLAGSVPTASGFGTLAAVEEQVVQDLLGQVVGAAHAAGASVVVHCCAPDVPLGLVRAAGAAAVSLDATLLTETSYDALAEVVEAGLDLFCGVVPAVPGNAEVVGPADARAAWNGGASTEPVKAAAERVRRLWGELGFAPEEVAKRVVVTPTCGMAGAPPPYARWAMKRAREVARALGEL
ncbi:methionine synthase [Carbonactinospora thermoautotrophica]|uniref:Methionine synthase n=2 Tax=Carbonactinospora thermoautotrophica TaxID=1469144 RepID=A0A132MP11_9ACTN|nr:methionine synthase [Carbonactinospora thermoautotrophica]KWW99596.1 Uncharacterized protein LI90_1232 [Carbonactinospora thermoautotrophica]KWX04021.1 methionine synthase [Carbonactinospora thermoautotrophica]